MFQEIETAHLLFCDFEEQERVIEGGQSKEVEMVNVIRDKNNSPALAVNENTEKKDLKEKVLKEAGQCRIL